MNLTIVYYENLFLIYFKFMSHNILNEQKKKKKNMWFNLLYISLYFLFIYFIVAIMVRTWLMRKKSFKKQWNWVKRQLKKSEKVLVSRN